MPAHYDTGLAGEVWEAALDAPWDGPPVWFHGDMEGDDRPRQRA